MVLKLCQVVGESREQREVVVQRKVLLNLWQHSCYSLGGPEQATQSAVVLTAAGAEDEPMGITAGQDFTLIRMSSGRVSSIFIYMYI